MIKLNIERINISVIFILLLLIGFYTTPYTDDFCMDILKHTKADVFSILKMRYNIKEGRYMSIPGMFQIAGFKYLSFNTLSVIWVFFFIALCILIGRLFIVSNDLFSLRTLFITCLILIGAEAAINDVVFWATGGSYYSVATFLMVLSFYILYNFGINRFILITPLVITIGPNYSLPILFIFLIELLYSKNLNSRKKLFISIITFIIFSIGLAIIILSPGTQSRLNTVSTYWNWHPKYIIEAVLTILYKAFLFYKLSIILVMICLYIAINKFNTSNKKILSRILDIIYEIRFLIASIGSVLVFVRTPGLFSERAGYAFFILIIIQFIYTLKDIKLKNYKIKYAGILISTLLSIVLIFTFLKTIEFNKLFIADLSKIQTIKDRKSFNSKYVFNTLNIPFKRFNFIDQENNEWLTDCFDNYINKNNIKNK